MAESYGIKPWEVPLLTYDQLTALTADPDSLRGSRVRGTVQQLQDKGVLPDDIPAISLEEAIAQARKQQNAKQREKHVASTPENA